MTTYDLKWLRENALFPCRDCREDRSVPASDLRIDVNGSLVCVDCYALGELFSEGGPEAKISDWHKLPRFDPFERLCYINDPVPSKPFTLPPEDEP